MQETPPDAIYSIRSVTRLTGVPSPTLRSWERRYGFPSPARDAASRRLYTPTDIDAIRELRNQLRLGLPLAQAIERQRHLREACGRPAALPVGHEPMTAERLITAMLDAAAAYDEQAVDAALSLAFALHPPDDVLLEVMTPVLHEAGECWRSGDLLVAAEHFITGVFRRRLFALLSQQSPRPSSTRVVLACPAGEGHELGLMMAAVFLRWQGFGTILLGANVPAPDLLSCLRRTAASVLCLSAVVPSSSTAPEEAAAQIAAAGLRVAVIAGGAAAPAGGPCIYHGPDLRGLGTVVEAAMRELDGLIPETVA